MKAHTPELVIPGDLTHLMDESVLATSKALHDISFDEMKAAMPEPLALDGDASGHRFAILEGAEPGDYSDALVLNLEHQQPWNLNHYLKARVLQALIDPDKPVIVMPNNAFGDAYYDLSKENLQRVKAGSASPFAEQQAQTLEALGVERALVTGYSWGGRLAVALAGVQPDFEIKAVNADEAPSKERSEIRLQLDFNGSGGLGDQKQAMRESGLESLRESSRNRHLLPDYAKFGIKGLTDGHSRSIIKVMVTSMKADVLALTQAMPDTRLKLGHVAGSKLFDPATVADISGIRVVEYGPAEQYQGHTSANNPFIHALMAKDGLLG